MFFRAVKSAAVVNMILRKNTDNPHGWVWI